MKENPILKLADNLYVDYHQKTLCSYSSSRNEILLTRLQFDLLNYMIENARIVLSYDQIIEAVWKDKELDSGEEQVRKAISKLRGYVKALAPDVDSNSLIQTRKGLGYIMNLKIPQSFSCTETAASPSPFFRRAA